jgi:hypothetical protein
MKKYLKLRFVENFAKLMRQNETKALVNGWIKSSNIKLPVLDNLSIPYDLNHQTQENEIRLRSDIVFVTGRFRSGSTLVWNLFRQMESCTAFYEPFNERQWFADDKRGVNVDKTHVGVDDYWAEYDGLNELSEFYDEDWTRYNLCMNEHSWNPSMLKFIESIISSTTGVPVLQFNRIDFRLGWIRHNFPNAKIMHIHRHPRDQWFSFLTDKKVMNSQDVELTYKDAFYLNSWCHDLKTQFPFLDINVTPHPYRRFYYLWKLSYLFGKEYSDYSFAYESLVSSPERELNRIFSALGWEIDSKKYTDIFEPPAFDKWKAYAGAEWFLQHEYYCENILNQFLKSD